MTVFFLRRVLPARKRHPFCAQRDPLVKRMIFYKNFKKFHKKLNWKFSSGTQKLFLVEIKNFRKFSISFFIHFWMKNFEIFEIEKFSKIFEIFHSNLYENEKFWDRKFSIFFDLKIFIENCMKNFPKKISIEKFSTKKIWTSIKYNFFSFSKCLMFFFVI